MNHPSPTLRRLWIAIGWVGVALLIYLSLMRGPPALDFADGDNVGHVAAYAALMLWFAQLSDAIGRRVVTAIALVMLGIALEYAQRETGYRTFDSHDMIANAIGAGIGWLAAPPRLPNLMVTAGRLAQVALISRPR